jgi:hypothetical protein
VTEAWGTLRFALTNPSAADKEMRLQAFYPEQPGVRYGRDVWVPAGSRAVSWVTVGPAPPQKSEAGRDLKFILYERAGDEWRPVPQRNAVEWPRTKREPYKKREPTTTLLIDAVADDTPGADVLSLPPAGEDYQALLLTRTFRQARGLSEQVNVVTERFLPAGPEGFDGVDQFVLAGSRLEHDPVGVQALRQWVGQGGTLWVMLDRVKPEVVASILGGDRRFGVVGRTGLTTVRLAPAGEKAERGEAREFDQPVELVRVVLGDGDVPLVEVDGWPAAFTRPLGRGRVFVTTLGSRAWHRPRLAREKRSPLENFKDHPVEVPAFERLASDLYTGPAKGEFAADELAPLLTTEIGYSVVPRRTAALVLGGFVLGLVALGVGLRYSRRPEVIGWLAPAAAAAAAAAFVALGAASRQAVPPTQGMVAVLDVLPGTDEAAAAGAFAVYRPTSGDTRLTSDRGGTVDLAAAALDAQVRHRMQDGLGAWHWENVTLPAGVQVGSVRTSVGTGPVSAVARFGPAGVEGRLATGRYPDPADAVILTGAREPVGVRLAAGGGFAVGPADLLPAGQFLADTVLTDRQRRRQEVYRKLLARPLAKHLDGRDLLFVWADAADPPVRFAGAERSVGSAVLAVPLEFERPAAGTAVLIPRGFIPASTAGKGRRPPPTLEASNRTDLPLRFQLPPSVLPLAVDRATLHLKVRAPARTVSVSGVADGRRVPLFEAESPVDPIRVEIADPRLLAPDADGGLAVAVAISDPVGGGEKAAAFGPEGGWKIESLTLEVSGRVGGRDR